MSDLLRVYFDPAELTSHGAYEGYPRLWHTRSFLMDYGTEPPFRTWEVPDPERLAAWEQERDVKTSWEESPPIKDLIRERDGHRCLRCGHPYRVGEMGNGQWTPCDEQCTHGGPVRWSNGSSWEMYAGKDVTIAQNVEAQWRILTTHHLNGVKHDCRWWNLVSLDQRCHLTIQGKVRMERPWVKEHSTWFKPFAAAYYAESILGEELTREEVDARLDDLLDLQPHTERML